jgi:hypothetical protein
MYHCAWPTWLPDVTSSNVTWPRSGSLGRVCACATGSCAISAPVGLFTDSDVIKRHVTPKEFHWKGGVRACATGRFVLSRPGGTFSPEVTSSNVTWPRRGSLGRVGCAHAQPEVGNFSLLESPFTGNDVMKLGHPCPITLSFSTN